MDTVSDTGEHTIESEFVRTIKYIDLFMQQKTDLFLQHYLFEPVNILRRQIIYLSVVVTIMAAGIVTLVVGMIYFIATFVPLWAALLISGIIIFGIGVVIAYNFFSEKIILKTPIATEMIKNEKT